MRKLLTAVLTALALTASPVAGQTSVRAFTWTGEGTFENVTCIQVPQATVCTYSQGNGTPGTAVDYITYEMQTVQPQAGADLCWVIGQYVAVGGSLGEYKNLQWARENMIGRVFCVAVVESGLVDNADGMLYLYDPATGAELQDLLDADPDLNPEGGTLYPTT